MTNLELAAAIETTYNKVISRGTGTDSYRLLIKHLESLLAEQLKRATTREQQ